MNVTLKAKCELFADNYTLIHNDFKWEYDIMNIVAASIYTNAGMKADIQKMKDCKRILKEKQSIFSDLRGTVELALLAKMAVSSVPENYLDEVINVYGKIKKGKIFTTDYMVLSAMIICDQRKALQAEEIIEKTKKIIKLMKKEHPILTGSEDIPFATLMAMMPTEESKLIADMEECFDVLKKKFPFHKDSVQGLCQVLTLSNMAGEDKCKKASDIFDALKKEGIKYGKSTELAALGALVDVDIDPALMAKEIEEASDLLKKHKGFGNFSLGKETRAMFAALLVAEDHAADKYGSTSTALGGAVAILIAEEIVLMMLMTIAAANSAASSAAN
ncbi:MAG: DUF4003 family protein [Lachnospiraceae bacterium]|nr:DUF4003 family protein [Lachnospiraceae bacterium]